MKLSIEERQAKLDALKKYDWDIIKSARLAELQALFEGVIPQNKRLKKQQLLDKIAELIGVVEPKVVEPKKEMIDFIPGKPTLADWILEPLTPKESEVLKAMNSNESYWGQLKQLLQKSVYIPLMQLDTQVDSFDEAKEVVIDLVSEIVQDQAVNFAKVTQPKNKSHYSNLIRALAKSTEGDSEHKFLVLVAPFFLTRLSKAFKSLTNEANTEYMESVVAKGKNEDQTQQIDIFSALRHSQMLLERVAAGEDARLDDLVFAVMLATGRRPTEVMNCGTFQPHGKYTLLFGNPAKLKKSAVDYWEGREIVIPTLLLANYVLKALELIREKMKGTRENSVAKALERLLTNKHYREDGFQKAYNCRAVYVHAAFKNHNEGRYSGLKANKLNLAGFGSVVLGHSERDLGTINSYICTVLKQNKSGELITIL